MALVKECQEKTNTKSNMKNILNQLGATAANLEGATPQELEILGMNSMGPAVQGPTFTNPMTSIKDAVQGPTFTNPMTSIKDAVAIPPVVPTANNFSPTTKSAADYIYGSDVARGY